MKALLLIAHGSRREASNDEVRALARDLQRRAAGQFDLVVPAFLELAEPSIPDGVDECVRQGASEIRVVPYFLSAGRHVATDIPGELAQAAQAHPGVRIDMSPYLGQHPRVTDLLLGLATQGLPVIDAA